MLELEHSLSRYVAVRADLAYDSITMHSDEQPYAFQGNQVVALGGLRFDVVPRDEPRAVRVFFAAELGVAFMHTDHFGAIQDVNSVRIEPMVAGLDLALTRHDLLRAEAAAMLYSTYEQVLSLAIGGAYAHIF